MKVGRGLCVTRQARVDAKFDQRFESDILTIPREIRANDSFIYFGNEWTMLYLEFPERRRCRRRRKRNEDWRGSRDRWEDLLGRAASYSYRISVMTRNPTCRDTRNIRLVSERERRREGGRKIERAPRSLFLELNQTSVTTLFEYNISSNISAEGPRRIAAGLFQDIYLIPSRDLRPFRDFLLLFSFLFFFFFARSPPGTRVRGRASLSKSTLSALVKNYATRGNNPVD